MAAAALPAARQISRPFGTGRRCAASTTSGCAAATAASKILRRRGRLSVIVSRDQASRDLLKRYGTPVIHPIGAKENPRGGPRGYSDCVNMGQFRPVDRYRLFSDPIVMSHDFRIADAGSQ